MFLPWADLHIMRANCVCWASPVANIDILVLFVTLYVLLMFLEPIPDFAMVVD
jgi:hypothetical protein